MVCLNICLTRHRLVPHFIHKTIIQSDFKRQFNGTFAGVDHLLIYCYNVPPPLKYVKMSIMKYIDYIS